MDEEAARSARSSSHKKLHLYIVLSDLTGNLPHPHHHASIASIYSSAQLHNRATAVVLLLTRFFNNVVDVA